ncbi:HtaA domain-containing protein [Streptomyces sp. NPDC001493]
MAANRRPIALAAAVATAAALGATFALPALAADPGTTTGTTTAAQATRLELKDGTLDWGFKQSFRSYIGAAGKITVSDGAEQAANNGAFTFVNGKGSYDLTTHGTDTAFEGGVNFWAHEGALDITLSDVKVSTTGTGGAITADLKTPQGTQDDVAVADLDLSAVRPGQGEGGAMVFKDIPATLTKLGSEAFNGMYQEGQALDPATLTVTAVTPPTEEPTKEPTGEPTGEPTKEPTGEPTDEPTKEPTTAPTNEPTGAPTPSASATTPALEQGALVDGTLDWGVKESFRSYVTGPIASGSVETTGGASTTANGYRFGDATGRFDAAKKTLQADFKGQVRFLGHKSGDTYALDLSFSALRVEVTGTSGKLIADVSSKDRATGRTEVSKGLAVADLTVPAAALTAKDGVVTLSGVPATLTEGGSAAFGGMYEKGEKLDALTVAVSLDADAQLPGAGSAGSTGSTGSTGGDGSTGTTGSADTTGSGSVGGGEGGSVGGSGSLAATGADLPTGALLAASGLVVALGAGAFAVARRRSADAAA